MIELSLSGLSLRIDRDVAIVIGIAAPLAATLLRWVISRRSKPK